MNVVTLVRQHKILNRSIPSHTQKLGNTNVNDPTGNERVVTPVRPHKILNRSIPLHTKAK